MSWGAGVWALVFLLACLLFAYEWTSPRRHRLRLALLLLPIVASLWIYGSAWLSIRTLRNLGLACASGDPVGVESCFASRVTVGVEDYERGPELVSRYMTTPRKKEEVEALRFHAGFSFSDPFHFYMVTCGDTDLGTDSAGMFRLALTPTGWKVDQEIYGGPPWRLPEIWTLAGCW